MTDVQIVQIAAAILVALVQTAAIVITIIRASARAESRVDVLLAQLQEQNRDTKAMLADHEERLQEHGEGLASLGWKRRR